jgi:heme-degrading monooxygenase HmoA
MASRMVELAQAQKGFLGMESARGSDGNGITVSYWQTEADIVEWKANSEHKLAQEFGRSHWYNTFTVRICKVEREYSFERESQ